MRSGATMSLPAMALLAAFVATAGRELSALEHEGDGTYGTSLSAVQHGPTAPLVLRDQGYFFVGGKYFSAPDGQFMADQMYVSYQIPQNLKHPYPIIFIHGGGLTGTYFEGTPDGREGWTTFFVRQGYAVYNVDQVTRGRSAYHADVYGSTGRTNVLGVEQSFTVPELFNRYPQAHLHTQWPGSGLPGDPIFDQFYASEVPQTNNAVMRIELMRDATVALLERIGPAILLTHSQSGQFWPIADSRPDLVAGIVTVEGIKDVHSVALIGPPTWFSYGPVTSPWGITSAPLTYDPPVSDPSQLTFVQQTMPDRPDLVRCYLQAEPARQLPHLQRIPMLDLVSEASFAAPQEHCLSKYLTQAGVKNTFVRLEDVGIHGNGHMMMIEKNNLEIAAFIQAWLEENVEEKVEK
jgi:pimeloyl-ACP methyl ester carboxylesterase